MSQTNATTARGGQVRSMAAAPSSAVIHTTTSLCRHCKNAVRAAVVERADEVWMEKACPEHGAQEVRLSNNVSWYRRVRQVKPKLTPPKKVVRDIAGGCPFDCGTCGAHEQQVKLPVVTITSACNLDCPICYVHNKNTDPYHMTTDDFAAILSHLRVEHNGDIDIVNFTGGEPTMHPNFLEFLSMAREARVRRISICSNGI